MARRRDLRIARGLVVGAIASVLTLAGHAGGGGHLPLGPGLLVAALLLGGSVVLAGRRLRLLPLLGLLVGSQVAGHLVLGLGHAAPPVRRGAAVAAEIDWSWLWDMAGAHLVVAGLLAALLRWGEDLVWRWAALVCSALGVDLPAPVPVPTYRPRPVIRHDDARRLGSGPSRGVRRRGPPAPLAA